MTLLYRHPASYGHDTGAHPENAGRIRAIDDALARASLSDLVEADAPLASLEQVGRAHDPEHVAALAAFCAAGGGMVDMDTIASEGTWEASLRASGAACEAVERTLAGDDRAAFCALRPPGHHAERARAMGFCFTNHVAVAAEHARSLGVGRVLIFDWDVHHGNGTEEIFAASPHVLYASVHQAPLYPGTGDASYDGEGEGEGYTINLPVPAGSGDEVFHSLTEHVVVPLAREYEPGLLLVSAGFDAHQADPLASCLVTAEGYRAMGSTMARLAADLEVPLVLCLEGGYDPGALGSSVVATLGALSEARSETELPDPTPAAHHRERLRGRWEL